MTQLRRVGHKGADLIAPGNTVASFDAALEAGVDMIEFDVLPEGERLVLAHDHGDAAARSPQTLDEGLAHLAGDRFGDIDLVLDLKLPGYELRVLESAALGRAAGALHDLVSQYRSSLRLIRQAEPRVRLGWSVPKLRHDPFRSPITTAPAFLALLALRALLPSWVEAELRRQRCDALMAHWRLVTPRLVRRVAAAGGELYVWTVDELPRLRALERLGVTGVITNDPRLFGALA